MSEEKRDLTGEIENLTLSSAEDFFGNSIGLLKKRLEKDRAQLQSLLESSPEGQEEAHSRLQKLLGSYEDVEYMLDRVIQKQGIEDFVEQALAGEPSTDEEAQQPSNDNLPPGSTLLSESTDGQGRTVLRSLDGSGTIIETVLAESGAPMSEDIVGVIADISPQDEPQ